MEDSQPYSNRELDSKFTDIMDSLDRIEVQTTTTNGKVANVSIWREQVTGAAKAYAACLVFIIIPIAAWALYNQVTEGERVRQSVKDTVSEYFAQYTVQVKQ